MRTCPAGLLRHPRSPQGARRGDQGPGPGAGLPEAVPAGHRPRRHVLLGGPVPPDLGETIRSTQTSPETFIRYKNTLLTHMTYFMAQLYRYLPRLASPAAETEPPPRRKTRTSCCASLSRPMSAVPRPNDDPPTTGAAAGPRSAPDSPPTPTTPTAPSATGHPVPGGGPAHRYPRRRLRRHRAAPPGHRGAARRGDPLLPAPPPRRVDCSTCRTRAPLTRSCRRRSTSGPRGTSAPRTTTPSRSPAARPGGTRLAWNLGHPVPAWGRPRRPASRNRPVQPRGQGRASPPPSRPTAKPNARPRSGSCSPGRTTGGSTTPRRRRCCAG